MRTCCLFAVGFLTVAVTLPAEEPVNTSGVQQAVQKSISWLETDMQTWRNDHGCAACHHGPMYLWSMNVARRQGYDVRESELAEMTDWLLNNDEARIFPKTETPISQTAKNSSVADRMTAAMMGHKNLSQPTIYLTHALNAIPDGQPLKTTGWRKVIDHLASAQQDDGSFVGRNAWRPIFNTPQILTRFVVSGIQDAGESDTAAGQQQRRVLNAAQAFLAHQTADETQQGLVLRILSEPTVRDSQSPSGTASTQVPLVDQLKRLQRADGGWSQTQDRDSDAFATGQALTALKRAGLSSADSAIRRGVGLLVRSQRPDGTWSMTSRPNPENGNPAKFLNPITYAATAWATIGLASVVPNHEP